MTESRSFIAREQGWWEATLEMAKGTLWVDENSLYFNCVYPGS